MPSLATGLQPGVKETRVTPAPSDPTPIDAPDARRPPRALRPAPPFDPASLRAMQRAVGNRAVCRQLAARRPPQPGPPVQRKIDYDRGWDDAGWLTAFYQWRTDVKDESVGQTWKSIEAAFTTCDDLITKLSGLATALPSKVDVIAAQVTALRKNLASFDRVIKFGERAAVLKGLNALQQRIGTARTTIEGAAQREQDDAAAQQQRVQDDAADQQRRDLQEQQLAGAMKTVDGERGELTGIREKLAAARAFAAPDILKFHSGRPGRLTTTTWQLPLLDDEEKWAEQRARLHASLATYNRESDPEQVTVALKHLGQKTKAVSSHANTATKVADGVRALVGEWCLVDLQYIEREIPRIRAFYNRFPAMDGYQAVQTLSIEVADLVTKRTFTVEEIREGMRLVGEYDKVSGAGHLAVYLDLVHKAIRKQPHKPSDRKAPGQIFDESLDSVAKDIQAQEQALLKQNTGLFRDNAGRGLGVRAALARSMITFTHSWTYRSDDEAKQKTGNQFGPFSRRYSVNIDGVGAKWAVHAHFKTSNPNAAVEIVRSHAKLLGNEGSHDYQAIWFNDPAVDAALISAIKRSADKSADERGRAGHNYKDLRALGGG